RPGSLGRRTLSPAYWTGWRADPVAADGRFAPYPGARLFPYRTDGVGVQSRPAQTAGRHLPESVARLGVHQSRGRPAGGGGCVCTADAALFFRRVGAAQELPPAPPDHRATHGGDRANAHGTDAVLFGLA